MTSATYTEELDADACLGLLARGHLGRLAFLDEVGVLPLLLPVNYALWDGSVVFRTDEGSKLSAAVRDAPVAFEVDELDEVRGNGWSVVVRGHAEEVTAAAAAGRPGPRAWAPGDKTHYVRVRASKISGRRITRTHSWSDWWE